MLAGVAVLLERCPFLAGVCTGLLVVKPHLAGLFPVAFLAGRQWRTIAGALCCLGGLLALSWSVLDSATLMAYPASWKATSYLMQARSGEFNLRQCTVYAAVWVIAGTMIAALAQVFSTGLVVWVTWAAWGQAWSTAAKFAVLFAATPLAMLYLFSYDLPFLVLPTIWLAAQERLSPEHGWRRLQLLGFCLAPLLTRAPALPLGANLSSG